MEKIITRKEYMDGKATHHDYYAQYVNNGIKETVKHSVTLEKLLASENKHLNDIPLAIWDGIATYQINTSSRIHQIAKQAGESVTLAFGVCVAKAAARIIINENKNK